MRSPGFSTADVRTAAPSVADGRHLIAVVDAEWAQRRELRTWIQRLGFDLAVVEGESGEDALWLRFGHGPTPALTVIGQSTPGAIEACTEIRTRETAEGRARSWIVLWGPDAEAAERALRGTVDHWLAGRSSPTSCWPSSACSSAPRGGPRGGEAGPLRPPGSPTRRAALSPLAAPVRSHPSRPRGPGP